MQKHNKLNICIYKESNDQNTLLKEPHFSNHTKYNIKGLHVELTIKIPKLTS